MHLYEVDLRLGQPDEMRMTVGGVSPLHSVITGVYEMLGPGQHFLSRAILAAAGQLARNVDLRPLRPIIAPSARWAGLPDFLTAGGESRFETTNQALERLSDTPTDVVREQIDRNQSHAGWHDGFAGWSARPRHKLASLTDALSIFEHKVFRPLFPNLEAQLRMHSEFLATAVGLGEGTRVLSTVHPHIARDGGMLRWPCMTNAGLPSVRRMTLYPMAASPEAVLTRDNSDDPDLLNIELTFTLPALALRDVRREARPTPVSPLQTLLGSARSTVLSTIAASNGHTTTMLSVQLQVSPSNVSYHLAALKKASLLHTERDGPNVTYRATPAAHRLLAAWD
jgi:DNA-binding transcriptional ArsR family regulator